MSITRRRYFLATVEHGGFRAAARAMNVAQPALLRQVRALEADLGIPLVRCEAGVTTTAEAGSIYARRLRSILADLAAADLEVQRSGGPQSLRIGVRCYFAGFQRAVISALELFRDRYADIRLRVEPHTPSHQIQAIASGELDGGFLYNHASPHGHLRHITVQIDHWLLALPRHHPLATKGEIVLNDLRDEPFVSIARDILPPVWDRLDIQCQRGGLTRRIVRLTSDVNTLFTMIGTGAGLSFVHTPAQPPDSVVLREVSDLDAALSLDFVWDPSNRSRALTSFLGGLHETGSADASFASGADENGIRGT